MSPGLDRFLDPLAALVLVAALFSASARRAESRVRIFTAQTVALSLWLVAFALEQGWIHLYVLAVAGFALKCIAVPHWLAATIPLRTRSEEQERPGGALSLLVAGALAAAARWITAGLPAGSLLARDAVGSGLASVLVGLFLAATRRRARDQATGLFVVENGVVLAAVAASGSATTALLVLAFEALLAGLVLAMRSPAMAEGVERAERRRAEEAEA